GGRVGTESSTYKNPRTTVPGFPDGLIFTSMTPDLPGSIISPENGAVRLIDASQRSPTSVVTAGSKAFAVTVIAMVTEPAVSACGYGPNSSGLATQLPGCTVPSAGANVPAARLPGAGSASRSASPCPGPQSNSTGRVAFAVTRALDACVGTNHSG